MICRILNALYPQTRYNTSMRLILGITLLLGGCRNDCEQLCVDMAAHAEEDCNKTFPDKQLQSCKDKYADASDQQLDTCKNLAPKLQDEWGCDKINEYFD
jgi:hypothetical protein